MRTVMADMFVSKRKKEHTVHFVDDEGRAYLSQFNEVLEMNTSGQCRPIVKLPEPNIISKIYKNHRLERLLRSNISHILCLSENTIIVFSNYYIYTLYKESIVKSFKIPSCRRPINVYFNESQGRIIWGDYMASHDNEINIYESNDYGQSWHIIYTFGRGVIRHIHNIVYDIYRKMYWVLTGDSDSESGIWKTDDFNSIEPFLVGQQKYRALGIIPTEDGLIIPTDTEDDINYIQYYSFANSKLEKIQKLDGSAFFVRHVGKHYLVSTVCEPSRVNRSKFADLWISQDAENWTRIMHLKGDIFSGKYFRYPSIKVPYYSDDYSGDSIYVSTRAIKGGDAVYQIK